MPRYVTVREARVHITTPGFRTKKVIVVTTLLDPKLYTKEDLAELHRQRWNNELDLRSLKTVMQMECLRCKTPELVRKEIWTHALAYNLIRTVMAQAASQHEVRPRSISFKATLQTLEAFPPVIALQGTRNSAFIAMLYERMLEAIVLHRVANRPDRFEPRRIKRRHKHYIPLAVPRYEAKRQILKGLTKTKRHSVMQPPSRHDGHKPHRSRSPPCIGETHLLVQDGSSGGAQRCWRNSLRC